jgi:hypothetical protein
LPEKAVIHSLAKLLFVGSPTILVVRPDLFFQLLVKVVQFIDRISPADLSIFLFAQPGKLLFEQIQHPLDKRLLSAVLLGHEITSIGFDIDFEGPQPKRLSCTGTTFVADQGASLISVLTGSSR